MCLFKRLLLAVWRTDWEGRKWRSGGREHTEGALMPIQVVKRSELIELKLGR